MVSVRLVALLLLALAPGLSARAQSPEAPLARNPAPDESWAAPSEAAVPRRGEAPASSDAPRADPSAVEAPRRNETPDDAAWEDFPGATAVPEGRDASKLPRLPEVPPLVPVDDTPAPARAAPARPRPPPGPPPAPNRVSLLGARTVGKGGLAAGLSLGFPTLSAKVAWGALPTLDAVLGLESLYGLMNEVRLGGRWMALDGRQWSIGLALEGGYAFFLRPASVEDKGARYLSGRRNWNVLAGFVGNYQMEGVRAPRLFLDLRYHLSLDTEPIQRTPLGGLPPQVVAGNAFPFRLGAEVPLTERTSYTLSVGMDTRTRPEDAAIMPVLSVGIVTGL